MIALDAPAMPKADANARELRTDIGLVENDLEYGSMVANSSGLVAVTTSVVIMEPDV